MTPNNYLLIAQKQNSFNEIGIRIQNMFIWLEKSVKVSNCEHMIRQKSRWQKIDFVSTEWAVVHAIRLSSVYKVFLDYCLKSFQFDVIMLRMDETHWFFLWRTEIRQEDYKRLLRYQYSIVSTLEDA